MKAWRVRLVLAVLALIVAQPASAQKTITDDVVDKLLQALAAEDAELQAAGPKLKAIDDDIKKFEECKKNMELAGEVSDSRAMGLAAKIAMKAKCGATSAEGYHKDKQKILQGPEKAALNIMKIKSGDYGMLKERVSSFLGGQRDGFAAAEVAALDKRKSELASAMRVSLAAAQTGGSTGGGARGGRNMNFSSPNYAWEYIGSMFQVMYLSGAMAFEKPYQPGEWTRWNLVRQFEGGNAADSEKTEFERAFLGTDPKGGDWWRTTQIDFYQDGGATRADTVVLEGLFKGDNEYIKQLVRMRGKFPGKTEAEELMVPQAFAMLSMASVFPFKPTQESIEGATVGTEKVAGYDAKHVKFGGSDGMLEWWISDAAPGGWVRFRHTDGGNKPATYTMEMVNKGTGAKSQLGVLK